jgi:Sec-independent protein translocase protein (TatC)
MAKLPGAIAGARIVGERFAHSRRRQNPQGRMPLLDHIRELRHRVVKMALALIAGMTAGFVLFGPAWHVIERPLCSATIRGHSGCRTLGVNQLVLNGPLDAFYLRVKVALIVGVIVSSPIWLYQIWAFVAPGLHAREKRWSCIFLGAAIPLFGIGIALCYLSLGRSMQGKPAGGAGRRQAGPVGRGGHLPGHRRQDQRRMGRRRRRGDHGPDRRLQPAVGCLTFRSAVCGIPELDQPVLSGL